MRNRATFNRWAVLSLVSGLACFLPLLGPALAFVSGSIALRQITARGGRGRSVAQTGIGLGAFVLVIQAAALWQYSAGH